MWCWVHSGGLRERAICCNRFCRRAFDLRRWALLDNPSLKSTGATYLTTRATGAPFLDDGSNIQCQNAYGMKYWFPIPQKERDINANLPQNPGW